jgi:hypothetical protein
VVLPPTPPVRKCFAPPTGDAWRKGVGNSVRRDQLSSREVLDIVWEYGTGLDLGGMDDDEVGLDLDYF